MTAHQNSEVSERGEGKERDLNDQETLCGSHAVALYVRYARFRNFVRSIAVSKCRNRTGPGCYPRL